MLLAGIRIYLHNTIPCAYVIQKIIFSGRELGLLRTKRKKERKRAKEDAYLLPMLSLFKVDYILHEKEHYTNIEFLCGPKIIN